MPKKLLVITYYWPPSAGGGVQRWLKFVKYLGEQGWEPVVFTPDNPDFAIRDESLQGDVPEGVEVIRFPIWELSRLLSSNKTQQGVVAKDQSISWMGRLLIWLRGNLIIPDPKRFWVKPSVDFLTDYIRRQPVDAIVTTGPPHSMHLIGLGLKKKTGVAWLADFRDPWSDWDILDELKTGNLAKALHRRWERKVMLQADRVLACTPEMEKLFQSKSPYIRTAMITNGVDEQDFEDYEADPSVLKTFTISHMGLLNDMRNPEQLWQVLEELCKEDEGFVDSLQLFLSGVISTSVLERLEGSVLGSKLRYEKYLSHEEVISQYAKSSVLLLLMNRSDNADWLIPGKLFEYLYAAREILAFGSRKSDVNDILRQCELPEVVDYEEREIIKSRILEAYQNFKAANHQVEVKNRAQFTRRKLSEQLADLLDEMTDLKS